MRQQPFLALQSTGITGQGAVASDDTMAGNNDADGVPVYGAADGAGGSGTPDAPRHIAITHGVPERDRQEGPPDALLKGGALQGQRHSKGDAPSREILVQFPDALLDDRRCTLRFRVGCLDKENRDDTGGIAGDLKNTDVGKQIPFIHFFHAVPPA